MGALTAVLVPVGKTVVSGLCSESRVSGRQDERETKGFSMNRHRSARKLAGAVDAPAAASTTVS
jgi:hypothetical protein